MGLFNKMFGDSTPKVTTENDIDWNNLTELSQLEQIVAESSGKPVIIFKHSTRCGISRMVLKGFESAYSIDFEEAKPYFLDLLNYREISNEIAVRFNVIHQSPQLLVIKNGVCIFHTSHSDIDAETLKSKL